MSGTGRIRLEERAVLRVAGADARDFLQGLLTCDMGSVGPATPRHGALLTPQGKILFEAIIHAPEPGSFLFDTDKALAGEFLKRLTFYRLRAAVTLQTEAGLCVVAGDDANVTLPADPRLAVLGRRGIVANQEAASGNGDPTPYRIRRIANGIAELGRDYESGEVFPHEANLDQLGGVSFTKGCYIGQEVVSRMQHRGTARSRFVPVAIDGPPPARGADIRAGEKPIGTMGSSLGGEGIALMRLDRLEDAVKDGLAVTCGTAQLTARQPAWADYTVAQGVPDMARSPAKAALAASASEAPRAWQRMLSGRRLDLLDPSPLDIEVADIAHGLARVARWNGQTVGEHAFSVAQHSLLVEDLVGRIEPRAPRELLLAALFHDAPEYVIGDMISPFKAVIGDSYKSVEARILQAIHIRLGLHGVLPAAWTQTIKKADRIAAFLEATQLAGFSREDAERFFGRPGKLGGARLDNLFALAPIPAADAQRRFGERAGLLGADLAAQ